MTQSQVCTESQCLLCENTVSTRSVRVHLRNCLNKQPPPDPGGNAAPLLVSIHGHHPDRTNAYALYTVCPGETTLLFLDLLIRAHWLECCGHLSRFVKGHTEFQCPEWGGSPRDFFTGVRSMDHPIASVIAPGGDAHYEYDMGSTTHLTVRVETAPPQATTWLQQKDPGSVITVVAQNLMPELCDTCGDAATCARGNEYSCRSCPHDPSTSRPLVNSPRDGVECFDNSEGPDLDLFDHLCLERAQAYNLAPA